MTVKTKMTMVYAEPNVGGYDGPLARDEMTAEDFDAMMAESLEQARAGQGISLTEAFNILRGSL